MPWPRNEPDPLESRRRQLAEQERLLSEQRKRLTEELQSGGASSTAQRAEPPVWRMEEDAPRPRVTELASPRKKNLARQRQQDMIIFFVCLIVLLVVGIVMWIVYLHSTSSVNGT